MLRNLDKELERHGHKAGSMGYFAALASRGLLQYIMRPLHSIAFEQCLRDTASAAERALGAVLEDLQRNAPMLMFMPPDDLHRLSLAINQLGSMCALAGAQLPGATQCQYYLTLGHQDTQPTSRATLRDLEDAFGILAGNGSYYLSAGRHSILEEALGGDLPLDIVSASAEPLQVAAQLG